MARTSSIPVDVREAISAFLNEAPAEVRPLAVSDAIDAVRRIFPGLEASDTDLIDTITGEAVAADVALEFDVQKPDKSGMLERWNNETRAVKKRLTHTELREARRREVNDTDGTLRRADEVKSRNRMF